MSNKGFNRPQWMRDRYDPDPLPIINVSPDCFIRCMTIDERGNPLPDTRVAVWYKNAMGSEHEPILNAATDTKGCVVVGPLNHRDELFIRARNTLGPELQYTTLEMEHVVSGNTDIPMCMIADW